MIDTVRGKFIMPWKKGVFDSVIPHWEMSQVERTDKEGVTTKQWTALHKDGMYINGTDELAHTIQCSLPRQIFHSDNTNLIKNQGELNHAFDQVKLLMRQVLETDTIPRWTRIDLVWNFIGNISEYIACFQHAKHPKVRSTVQVFQNESIKWNGRKTEIQIYDKCKEKKIPVKDANRTIVRAELRLKKIQNATADTKLEDNITAQICEPVLGGYLPTFNKCYKHYRSLMVLLSPKKVPNLSGRSITDFLAVLQAQGLVDQQGIHLVDLFLAQKSKASKYRIMKQVSNKVVKHKFINFHNLLPETDTPKAVGYDDLSKCA